MFNFGDNAKTVRPVHPAETGGDNWAEPNTQMTYLQANEFVDLGRSLVVKFSVTYVPGPAGGTAIAQAILDAITAKSDQTALDAHEADAANPHGVTAAQIGGPAIKVEYEGESNTNAFTDSEKAKLGSIDAAHYGAPVQSTAALAALTEASLTDKERRYVEDAISDYFYDITAASGDIAPADQTGGTGWWKQVSVGGETASSIKTKYESNADTNAFTDAEQSKLTAIAANAQVNRALASQIEAEAGTENTKGMTPLRVAEAITALGGGGGAVSSAELAYPSNSYVAWSHGLGATPTQFGAKAICKTAQNGYAIGDVINLGLQYVNSTNGGVCMANATEVRWVQDNIARVPTKTGGAPALLTASYWKVILWAVA